ncbi:hypothetical protein B0T14DRAFT_514201 [Immersiella caudata]|uniref:Secreted protein n=1 Tax=Immersiella caudata TaxID=314043 RepID=A0AA39WVZ1_9PEZI|nr:hypothetical protein B0T14DRAFT_514201 [Immersiella caudata]
MLFFDRVLTFFLFFKASGACRWFLGSPLAVVTPRPRPRPRPQNNAIPLNMQLYFFHQAITSRTESLGIPQSLPFTCMHLTQRGMWDDSLKRNSWTAVGLIISGVHGDKWDNMQ